MEPAWFEIWAHFNQLRNTNVKVGDDGDIYRIANICEGPNYGIKRP